MLASCLFFFPLFVRAESDILPGNLFLAAALKALDYDRKIDRLSQGSVVIGIIYINGDEPAEDFARKVMNNFQDIRFNTKLNNLPVELKSLGLDRTVDKKTLEKQFKQNNISVALVAIQDPDTNKILFEMTRSLGVDSVCYSSVCDKQGSGIGVVVKENRVGFLVNMSAVKQEGSDYSGQFLDLCQAVK